MTNEEHFEQMFPALVNADAFTLGKTRFVRIDKVLEIIDRTIDEDDKSPISWTAACKAIRRDVLDLKGGDE